MMLSYARGDSDYPRLSTRRAVTLTQTPVVDISTAFSIVLTISTDEKQTVEGANVSPKGAPSIFQPLSSKFVETYKTVKQTSYRTLPMPCGVRHGVSFALNLSTYDAQTEVGGWQHHLKSI